MLIRTPVVERRLSLLRSPQLETRYTPQDNCWW
ncbi:hypothetical protein SAMN05443668_12668 [Cryptosporangium aurantiacum]|uniref:Uncharacterized protein n=1 Tax=Cryptosporangium aurantiacum TaxID=134849 RepID=A0A1M7RNL6_9ACTN|nr:hypothetical protein SAMN05443668_12668 [Cryptosporangium aurantiacum]